MKTPKEILRQHLHGMSDEQFKEAIGKYPLNEALFAIEGYHAQFEKEFRSFIRTHHLTGKWQQFLVDNDIKLHQPPIK